MNRFSRSKFLPDLNPAPAPLPANPPVAAPAPYLGPLLTRRPYQVEALKRAETTGFLALLWRRQAGKSTTLADIALKKMLKRPGRLVTFASASLLVGREIIHKESQVLMRALGALRPNPGHFLLEVKDGHSNRTLPIPTPEPDALASPDLPIDGFAADDFAELFEAQRLEFRVYHDNAVFSRTQVIAPNPATARGWSGDVLIDEIGFIKDFRSLWEAMEPIASADPSFSVLMSTTPPADDAHFAFELLAPELKTGFEVCARGNWYSSQARILVHRCDIYDTDAAGTHVYDLDTRQPLPPEQHFLRAIDKQAWRRNYGLEFQAGGISAISLACLERAQQAGHGQCLFQSLESSADFDAALDFLAAHLGDGPVGIGLDPATTDKETSNPSGLAVMEKVGDLTFARLILVWKTSDPAQAERTLEAVLDRVRSRPAGGGALRLCIDATNERYFAAHLRQRFENLTYVELIAGSDAAFLPGESESISMKAFLGHQFINALEQHRLALPPEAYVKEDLRLVKRARGSFQNELGSQGMHGDTFDACKLAYRAVTEGKPGPIAFVV